MEHSNCTAAATCSPADTAAVKLALPRFDFRHVARTVILTGTGTAAHHTADDTGRDEVKSEHVPLPTGGIGRVPLVPLHGGRRCGRRPTAYGKVSCFSTRLVQRAVRGYLPVRRFALALHACFVTPPCCLWGECPQQAGHCAGT
jgi:hypothetical protein